MIVILVMLVAAETLASLAIFVILVRSGILVISAILVRSGILVIFVILVRLGIPSNSRNGSPPL